MRRTGPKSLDALRRQPHSVVKRPRCVKTAALAIGLALLAVGCGHSTPKHPGVLVGPSPALLVRFFMDDPGAQDRILQRCGLTAHPLHNPAEMRFVTQWQSIKMAIACLSASPGVRTVRQVKLG